MSSYETILYEEKLAILEGERHHQLFAMLKPSLQRDGNQWCVLYGDNLQEGIAGFGDSPYDAVNDFNKAWYKKIELKEKGESDG